jgi:hypothetical protein
LQDSNSDMAIQWTDDDKARLTQKEVIIFQQNVNPATMNDKGMPNDIHLVEYSQNGMTHNDLVRAGKMSDIFDAYYDRLKMMGEGRVTSIKSGYGTITPKLYNPEPKKDNK